MHSTSKGNELLSFLGIAFYCGDKKFILLPVSKAWLPGVSDSPIIQAYVPMTPQRREWLLHISTRYPKGMPWDCWMDTLVSSVTFKLSLSNCFLWGYLVSISDSINTLDNHITFFSLIFPTEVTRSEQQPHSCIIWGEIMLSKTTTTSRELLTMDDAYLFKRDLWRSDSP